MQGYLAMKLLLLVPNVFISRILYLVVYLFLSKYHLQKVGLELHEQWR